MLIYQGVKAQDIDFLVVWKTDRDDIVASRAWDLGEALKVTYRNLVEAALLKKVENPERDATLSITGAIETGIDLMKMGFAPTPEIIAEISLSLGIVDIDVTPDE